MNPAEGDQIMIILECKYFFLIMHVAAIWRSILFRDYRVGNAVYATAALKVD